MTTASGSRAAELVETAVRRAREVGRDAQWRRWAQRWIEAEDRTAASAKSEYARIRVASGRLHPEEFFKRVSSELDPDEDNPEDEANASLIAAMERVEPLPRAVDLEAEVALNALLAAEFSCIAAFAHATADLYGARWSAVASLRFARLAETAAERLKARAVD